jgi:Protein of unknown function (DUF5818)
MRSFKRNLMDLFALVAMVLAVAVAWGNPLAGAGYTRAQEQAQSQQQPDGSQAEAATFTGTIVKNGKQYLLHDSSGQIYGLDDSAKAKAFEGKTVKVTGLLDEQANLLHVENIKSAEA